MSVKKEASGRRSVQVEVEVPVAAAACGNRYLDEAVGGDLRRRRSGPLFRLAMQCQVIDDALDHPCDRAAGPPSVLTACESLPRAQELTRLAARGYAADRLAARPADVWLLRVALFLVSALAGPALLLRALGLVAPRTA
jgi:hypothetical protein